MWEKTVGQGRRVLQEKYSCPKGQPKRKEKEETRKETWNGYWEVLLSTEGGDRRLEKGGVFQGKKTRAKSRPA